MIFLLLINTILLHLNLNPKKEENNFQTNDVETLLERICKSTYLRESGWEIIRKQGYPEPDESTCEYKKGLNSFEIRN